MMHKTKTHFFFLSIIVLMSIHNTAICMNLENDKLQAEIDLLRKQLETENLKQTQNEALNTEKINTQRSQVQKLQSDIRQNDLHVKTVDGLIQGGAQGLSQGISNTIQHGGKKIIDLWLDGSLTTAETLIELEKREDILTKRLQNTRETAAAQRPYLKTPAEVEALNNKTYLEFQKINKELNRNAELYEQVVAGRSKQQSTTTTTEKNDIASEIPVQNKPVTETVTPNNNHKPTDEIKVKTGVFAAISASCFTAVNKAGICADFLAGYSFDHITKLNCFKETFIGKHSVGINRTLVAATLVATTYAAYRLYKSKANSADDDDIFNDDDMYEF